MNWLERKLFKAKTGADIVDLGRADEAVIRYKDKLISVLEYPDDGEIKSLGWMYDNEMHTHLPVREFWQATPPQVAGQLDTDSEASNDQLNIAPLPHPPTEDTPTPHAICIVEGCGTKILPNTSLCPMHRAIKEREGQQDDKQLREAFKKILLEVRFTKHADDGADEIIALFQKEQLQLVTELMKQSQSVLYVADEGSRKVYSEKPEQAIPVEALEHKKQELERGK